MLASCAVEGRVAGLMICFLGLGKTCNNPECDNDDGDENDQRKDVLRETRTGGRNSIFSRRVDRIDTNDDNVVNHNAADVLGKCMCFLWD